MLTPYIVAVSTANIASALSFVPCVVAVPQPSRLRQPLAVTHLPDLSFRTPPQAIGPHAAFKRVRNLKLDLIRPAVFISLLQGQAAEQQP